MDMNNIEEEDFSLFLDQETAEKFKHIMNTENLMHAGHTSHQSNSDMITPADKFLPDTE